MGRCPPPMSVGRCAAGKPSSRSGVFSLALWDPSLGHENTGRRADHRPSDGQQPHARFPEVGTKSFDSETCFHRRNGPAPRRPHFHVKTLALWGRASLLNRFLSYS